MMSFFFLQQFLNQFLVNSVNTWKNYLFVTLNGIVVFRYKLHANIGLIYFYLFTYYFCLLKIAFYKISWKTELDMLLFISRVNISY